MFVVFPEFCEHTQTHTQYDYYTLPPTLRGEGNNYYDNFTHKTMIAIKIIMIFLLVSLAMQYGFLKQFQTGEVGINTH